MDPSSIHTFIVKIWLERREVEGARPEWRGRIDHIPSGAHIYFRKLAGILDFVRAILNESESGIPTVREHHEKGE